MLRDPTLQKFEIKMVTLEELVPQNHLLRKIDKFISFDFIRDKVRHCYFPDNGRPAIHPVILFKMLFIGYLFGIRSERRLVQEIHLNVAYRWFLRMRLTDKVIDAATISQTHRRRFADSSIHQEIFDEIVNQAMGYRMVVVGDRVLYTDNTHLKANANKKKLKEIDVTITPKAYLDALDHSINEDWEQHGKKPQRRHAKAAKSEQGKSPATVPAGETRIIKQSTTNPLLK